MSKKSNLWRDMRRLLLVAIRSFASVLVSSIALHAPADAYPPWPQWFDYYLFLQIWWWGSAVWGVICVGLIVASLVVLALVDGDVVSRKGETP